MTWVRVLWVKSYVGGLVIKWIILLILFVEMAMAGNSSSEIRQRCQHPTPNETPIYTSDFKWDFELFEMLQKFTEIYQSSNKRLLHRAYWDKEENSLKLPYREYNGGTIRIEPTFVQSVARHIERAFELDYIDAVFFPDMGHSHLLIPEESMKIKYSKYAPSQASRMYEEVFKDQSVEIIYHTAEQLKMLDENNNVINDPRVKWRHQTRNIVGKISPDADLRLLMNPKSAANTVHGDKGFYWWGGGFNLSANKNGCFEYKKNGQSFFFDISMFDLEPEPGDVYLDQ